MMGIVMKKVSLSVAAVTVAMGLGSASAADLGKVYTKAPAPVVVSPWDVAFGASIMSNYVFRGVTQSDGQPSPQGDLHAIVGPWYAGVSAEDVRRDDERAGAELIPATIIERAPSAELRADQRDEDSLPPYTELDRVLKAYVEDDRSREELSSDGFDPALVERAVALVDRAEYKRRQAPPGVKIHPKAFGRDRRTPITNRWPG